MTVSIPAMESVGEEDGMVEVCATLCAVEETEKEFDIMLATNDDLGKCWLRALSMTSD